MTARMTDERLEEIRRLQNSGQAWDRYAAIDELISELDRLRSLDTPWLKPGEITEPGWYWHYGGQGLKPELVRVWFIDDAWRTQYGDRCELIGGIWKLATEPEPPNA